MINIQSSSCLPYPQFHLEKNGVPVRAGGGQNFLCPRFRVTHEPPSPDVKITDKIDLGRLSPGGPSPIKDFMDTKFGPLCYEYV